MSNNKKDAKREEIIALQNDENTLLRANKKTESRHAQKV